MNSKEKKPVMTEEDIMKLLDSCYEKCLNGIPKVSPSVEELANDYLKKHRTTEEACRAMLKKSNCKMHNFRSSNWIWRFYYNASRYPG